MDQAATTDSEDEFDYEEMKCIFDDTSSITNTMSTSGLSGTLPHGDLQSP